MSIDSAQYDARREIIERARRMRREPTRAEGLLWEHLRKRRLGGYKFRQQHIIQRFIVDFYCPIARLVVEIDGSVHDLQKAYDEERTKRLQEQGFQELRFLNDEVEIDIERVLRQIYARCVRLTPSPALPLSRGRVPAKQAGKGR